jgi:tRNA(fMet)-specific endonuclease VapC
MSFLLDTDTCSAHLKQKGNLSHKFLQYLGRLHMSVITVGELYTWALRSKAPPQ